MKSTYLRQEGTFTQRWYPKSEQSIFYLSDKTFREALGKAGITVEVFDNDLTAVPKFHEFRLMGSLDYTLGEILLSAEELILEAAEALIREATDKKSSKVLLHRTPTLDIYKSDNAYSVSLRAKIEE